MTNLKRYLLKNCITQQELAEYCKISIGSVQAFCQHKRPIESCRLETLLKMAECLECGFTDLLEDDYLKRRVIENVMTHRSGTGVRTGA